MFKWSKWSTSRRIRSLEIMEDFVMKKTPFESQRYWHEEVYPSGASPEEKQRVAADDTLYANALFAFYIAVTTDTSWLDGLVK